MKISINNFFYRGDEIKVAIISFVFIIFMFFLPYLLSDPKIKQDTRKTILLSTNDLINLPIVRIGSGVR